MTLTKHVEFALRVLIRLGIAHRRGEGVISMAQLAEQENIPFKFLQLIVFDLRVAGYVTCLRGVKGGVKIERPPALVNVGELVRLFQGDIGLVDCIRETNYARCSCPDEATCGLRMLMIDIRNAVAAIMDRCTLDHLIDVTLHKDERPSNTMDRVGHHTGRSDPSFGFLARLLKARQP